MPYCQLLFLLPLLLHVPHAEALQEADVLADPVLKLTGSLYR